MLKEALGYKFEEKPKVNTLKEKIECWELRINELAEVGAFKPTETKMIKSVISEAKSFYETNKLPSFATSEEQMVEYVGEFIKSQLDRYVPVLNRKNLTFEKIVESLGNYKVFGAEAGYYVSKKLDTNLFEANVKQIVEQSAEKAKMLREELDSFGVSRDLSLDEAFDTIPGLSTRLHDRYERLVKESNRVLNFIETVQGIVNELR